MVPVGARDSSPTVLSPVTTAFLARAMLAVLSSWSPATNDCIETPLRSSKAYAAFIPRSLPLASPTELRSGANSPSEESAILPLPDSSFCDCRTRDTKNWRNRPEADGSSTPGAVHADITRAKRRLRREQTRGSSAAAANVRTQLDCAVGSHLLRKTGSKEVHRWGDRMGVWECRELRRRNGDLMDVPQNTALARCGSYPANKF